MPQNASGSFIAKNANNSFAPLQVDANGNLKVAIAEDSSDNTPVLNITTNTLIAGVPGSITQLFVVVAGSVAGTVNDAATVAAANTGNRIAILPNVVGPVISNWPYNQGLVIMPGAGQTIAVAFSAG